MSENMCDKVLIRPPPPLPINKTIEPTTKIRTSLCPPVSVDDEVREACRRRGLASSVGPFRSHLRRIAPILQNGPTCGPVALAMLLESTSPEELVTLAREEGFTNNGEMFSCRDMVVLAQAAVRRLALPLDFALHRDDLCSASVVEGLLDGTALLVPYDADFNHAPCLRRGHKAHWALIAGVLVLDAPDGDGSYNMENVLVLARHGKSAHLAAWKLSELAASNANLLEFPPQREGDGLEYVVPPGGVAGDRGLRSQYIVVRGL